MKMQKIQHLCDICHLEDGIEQPATTLAVQFGINTNVMVADMCQRHVDYLNDTLDLYFQAGRRPDTVVVPKAPKAKGKGGPKPTPAGDFPCPVTGCPRSFTSEQGVHMHKTRVHKIPGIAKHGQEAHDAAIAAASASDVATPTTGNTVKVALPTRAGMTEAQREKERERDRARKARKRQELAAAREN
jgi:hypothetical protein